MRRRRRRADDPAGGRKVRLTAAPLAERAPGEAFPQTVLVVDDNVDTRELLHLYLTREGYAVVTAADGGEGLYRANADRPNQIITDSIMPNLDDTTMDLIPVCAT